MSNCFREEYEILEHRKVNQGKVWFCISAVLMVAVLVLSGIVVNLLRQREKLEEESSMAVFLEEEKNAELEAFIGKVKENADRYTPGTDFLQQLFPDVFIYRGENGYVYHQPLETLEKNQLDWDQLSLDENGVISYDDGTVQALHGIDVSKYQGEIDWQKVKDSGVDYGMIRLGYRGYETGKVCLDEWFDANISGANEVSLPVGVYFYSQAITVEEAIEEAEFVLEHIDGYTVDYPIVFDTEETASKTGRADTLSPSLRTDIITAFCERIKSAGYTPMVYLSVRWYLEEMEPERLEPYDIWLASYRNNPYYPYRISMWQYTASGSVDGIEGDVDLNLCFQQYVEESLPLTSETP